MDPNTTGETTEVLEYPTMIYLSTGYQPDIGRKHALQKVRMRDTISVILCLGFSGE